MTQDEYGIDLVDRLDSLLNDVINKYDIIAPIARKGIRVLELSTYADTLFNRGKVLYADYAQFHPKELKNKKILLFDESVRSGKSLIKSKMKLDTLSQEKKLGLIVDTAALIILDQVRDLPLHYKKDLVCDHNLYDILSDELSDKILSRGIPFDIDHPIITLEIPDEKITDLSKYLNNIAPTVELDHSGSFDNVRMFTLDFEENFPIPQIDGYPNILEEGPKKIRLFLKDNILRCVPVVYPCLDLSENICKLQRNCRIKTAHGKESFCKVLNLKDDLGEASFEFKSSLCYTCVVTELNTRLIGQFLNKLKNLIDFKFIGLEKRSFNAMYLLEGKRLANIIEDKIKRSMKNDGLPCISNEIAKRCHVKRINPNKKKYLVNNLRSEIKVSMIISQYAKENQEIFKYGDYSVTNPSMGLSYSQISSLMKELGEDQFSEGMDIALDIGLIKPINAIEGLEVNYKTGGIRGIIRLYCLASEDVDKSLNFFNELIIKKD